MLLSGAIILMKNYLFIASKVNEAVPPVPGGSGWARTPFHRRPGNPVHTHTHSIHILHLLQYYVPCLPSILHRAAATVTGCISLGPAETDDHFPHERMDGLSFPDHPVHDRIPRQEVSFYFYGCVFAVVLFRFATNSQKCPVGASPTRTHGNDDKRNGRNLRWSFITPGRFFSTPCFPFVAWRTGALRPTIIRR